MPDAIVISCGTELVTGQCVDTNAAWQSEQLTPFGVRVVEHVTVGDDVDRIRDAIARALDQAELIVMTGGLGPTLDDVTREGIAAAIGEPLEENAEALAQIRAFFDRWQRAMPESNRRQAMIPHRCTALPNPRGTAPGIGYEKGSLQLFAFPGVPAEMKAMFAETVVPMLSRRMGEACTLSARLLCFGLAEAKLGETLADLMVRGRNPLVGTTASQAVLSVRIVADGRTLEDARRCLDADLAEIRRRLGPTVFGQDDQTLEQVVAGLLVEQRKTVATAESCTGGLLAKRLTDVPGSSEYFQRGYVTYSDEAKVDLLNVPTGVLAIHGAVSEEVASAMAIGCRAAARSDVALAITGIAGPSGSNPPQKPVGLVYLALADSAGIKVQRLLLGDHLTRGEVRDRACKSALNLLRLWLLETDRP